MTSKAQQIELDNALVAPENLRVIGKCNMRIIPGMKPKEPTYQVALDALALTTCYPAFLITSEVLVIYMHQFWATVIKHKSSYQFKIDNKRFSVNVEVFREILNICPKVSGKAFNEPPTEEEALSFIRELGHTREIKYITDVIVDYLHQLWRTFASIINKCLCGKVSGLIKIRLSRVQILWGMYYKKNLDFVALIWENLAYQIDNIHSKKQDKMDDNLLGTMRFVSRDVDNQVYGAILPQAMTNQALLDSVAYKTYYAIASGAELPMSRKSQKKSDSTILFEESPSKKKYAKVKKVATAKPKPTKKKAPVKADRGKGLNVLSEVALSEAVQLKKATKRSKKDFHISQASGSGDGTDFESGVPDEQHLKTTGADEGNEEDEDDENDTEDISDDGDDDDDGNDGNEGNDDDDDASDDDNQEGDDTNDDDEETDSDRTELDRYKIHVLNQSSTEYYEEEEEKIDDKEAMDDEEDDEVTKELYKDVNVNLGNEDTEMTDADQGALEQQNVSHESGFEQVDKDAHVTLTPVLDTQKANEPVQSSSVSSDFTSKLLNLEKFFTLRSYNSTSSDSPSSSLRLCNSLIEKNVTESLEAAVLERSSSQPKSTYEAAASLSEFELTKILLNKMEKNKSYDKAAYKRELYCSINDKDKDRDPSAGSDRGTKRRKSRKEAESSRDSRSKEKKSSSTSKDPSHSQQKPSGKSAAHAKEPSPHIDDSGVALNHKSLTRITMMHNPLTRRQHVDFRPPQTCISQVAHAKEPRTSFNELMDTSFDFIAFVLNRLNIKDLTQEILVATTERLDWHNPEGKPYMFDLSKPLPLIQDHRSRQVIPQDFFINNDLEYLKGGDLSKRYSTLVMKTKAATYEIKWIEDFVQNLWSPVTVKYDKHAYKGTSYLGPKRQHFYGFAANMSSLKDVYSRKRIIAVTRLTIIKKYDYGHLEEIEVRRDDKLMNLIIDERYALNVALRMFTRRIIIQRQVEDLQLGVESYQKKLNLTKLDTFRSNLRNRTTYTAYSDPKGVIYKDQNNINRLMRADKLHKFSDGT
ncbi:hypothetical protein Tco_1014317 [Tanacetum coccineum]